MTMQFQEDRLHDIFSQFQTRFVAVIGDVMLDRYIWGSVTRISPEAPVPVVDVIRESNHLGGASNVALNIRSLGAVPVLFGVVGNDANADALRGIFEQERIITDFLIEDPSRPTTVKTRIIAGSQHVARIDYEDRQVVGEETTRRLLDRLDGHLGSINIIILQDYNKGVISPGLIHQVIEMARSRGIPVLVDPKFHNFFEYTGVTVFKPNRKETEDALKRRLHDEQSFIDAARALRQRLGCEHVLLTLGEKGMLLLRSDDSIVRVPTKARKVADVSGAGDTVIATLAVSMAGGADMSEAAQIANLAGGLVCEEVGIVPVDRDLLYDAALGRLGVPD
ncbi:MAG: D-glycero-beta-D-manno-heptose-7-phosphate kinase [Bacteroidota bacterium]|jgi:rfaE bifunctional protein kinase chain/domain|nr:D-glycero-beta-D-manno-heptose-7-phosphate kinase [Bacteroidota bacterium]